MFAELESVPDMLLCPLECCGLQLVAGGATLNAPDDTNVAPKDKILADFAVLSGIRVAP